MTGTIGGVGGSGGATGIGRGTVAGGRKTSSVSLSSSADCEDEDVVDENVRFVRGNDESINVGVDTDGFGET